MNSKRLLLLLLLCVKTAICASDQTMQAMSSDTSHGDILMHAVHQGSQAEYEPVLASLQHPGHKFSFYCPERERIARILPLRLCIDAIFERDQENSFSLIAMVDQYIVQRDRQVLQKPCFRKQLPFAYAYEKLTGDYWLDKDAPFVARLFTLLAGDCINERLIALQLISQDKQWYSTAIKTVQQFPGVLKNLRDELNTLDEPPLVDIMLRQEQLKSVVGKVAVQLTWSVNSDVAYAHMCRLLESQQDKAVYDMQEAKNRLLFWASANPQLDTKFFTQLLRHKADPYALMVSQGPITPLEQALATALNTQHDERTNCSVLNRLQMMLNISELDSAQCRLLIDPVRLAQDPDDAHYWADEVHGRMRQTISEKFKECGMEPFLDNLSFWENIVSSLGADKERQRRKIYDFLTKRASYEMLREESGFEQFCMAMQVQKFCSLVAQNLTDDTVAIDLYAFLMHGIQKEHFDPHAIIAHKRYTHTLLETLTPEARIHINVIMRQNKSA